MRKSEDYWIIFSKTGKVEDYLRYRAIEDEERQREQNASEHKRIDS